MTGKFKNEGSPRTIRIFSENELFDTVARAIHAGFLTEDQGVELCEAGIQTLRRGEPVDFNYRVVKVDDLHH